MYTYNICCCIRRRYKPASNEPSPAIKEIFKEYAGKDGVMSFDQLERFMLEVQKEADPFRAAQSVFDSIHEFRLVKKKKSLSLDAFFHNFLFGNENSPLSLGVNQDMKAPLSHYFIYTGHNSYLTGNQLTSDCSVEPIRKALERGVRGIELDVWPNDTHDDINVLHGRLHKYI
ncbi:hypothetical protein LUZ60_003776 [Juncus effusus]|nr:hypothetical protein LUZ60_003776 [Juncus effusus]